MKKSILLFTVLLLTSLTNAVAQADDAEFKIWVGREPKDLPTLLAQYQKNCERRYISKIEKYKKPYDVAEKYTRDHCKCVQRFFVAKDDPMYVQVVNLELRGALSSQPKLPPELEIYLDFHEQVRQDCEKDPAYVSESEAEARADREIERADTNKNIKMREGDKSKPRLPFRPQKQNNEERGGRAALPAPATA